MSESILLPTFLLLTLISVSAGVDTITPSRPLSDGETLISADGTFALGFFTPPDTSNRFVGIWYHNLSAFTVVWVANRRNPLSNSNGTLSITKGSLHLTDGGVKSIAICSFPSTSSSVSATNPAAQLLDTGNLVVKDASFSSSYLWQSFDHPTDTMLPGMKLGPKLKTGVDRNLTSWRSPSDPSPGNYTFTIDPRGVPQLVISNGFNWSWRGGPWNGFGFTGAGPEKFYDIALYREFISGFIANPDEIYYYFNMVGDAISMVKIDNNGTVRRLEWLASSSRWETDWLAPGDACDYLSACGANAICDTRSLPICQCLDGFKPRNSVSWGQGNWSDGCVRSENLRCHANGTDEFVVVRSAKLPDTASAVKNMSLGLEGCGARCLMNCSCTAYASADLSAGVNGCIIWTEDIKDLRVYRTGGQDLYVRVVARNHGNKKKPWIFAVSAVATVLLLLAILLCVLRIRRWRHKNLHEEVSISSLNWSDEMMLKLEGGKEGNSKISAFQFPQLLNATKNFSIANKLGEGGFGTVYKGKLGEGHYVAIKRLSAGSGQGLVEFNNEILLIAKLQHRNLVRLLGCCNHGEEKLLIYEYMPNKSLDLMLFNAEQRSKLEWSLRFHIVEGIAQGILYLHKHSRLRVIHRDLKASNILLDAEMNPKISDFGMARIFDANETQANTRRIVGTYGYISPEYAFKGLFSVKSDVFSFGVLLLEIVSGKRNAGFHEFGSSCNLLAHAWDLWKGGTWMDLVDPALGKQFRQGEMARCIYVALLCVQESPEDRPVMSDVVSMLGNENLSFKNPKQPAFFTMKISSDANWPFSLHVNQSVNDLSVTVVEGR